MEKIKVLIEAKKIQERIKQLADEIMKDYKDEEILILSVLKGAVFFTVDLAKQINNKTEFEFIKLSSYGNAKVSSGKVEIKQDITSKIKGKNILIVEDIIDTGITMKFLKEYLLKFEVNSVKVATLLNKPERRQVDVKIDYIGFNIPNKFVVGYGLDNKEYLRNLPYIGYIE
ncbi:MAG: hypoxanthine phosphoribosyltransferase [Candidatus Scatovivens sp.]